MIEKIVEAEEGSTIKWTVSLEGYVTQTGSYLVGPNDDTVEVILEQIKRKITLTTIPPEAKLTFQVIPPPKEVFKFTVNSGDDSSFILPLSSQYSIKSNLTTYNMNVDWGDGQTETITGDVSNGYGVTHSYATANQDYEITLTPAGDENGWMCGLGFNSGDVGCNTSVNKVKVKKLSSPYTEKMLIRGGNTDHVLTNAWNGCSGITTLEEGFNLPKDLTIVGEDFCFCMFRGCASLVSVPSSFQLPQKLTRSGAYCFDSLFDGCRSLVSLPDTLTFPSEWQPYSSSTSWNFCSRTFRDCSSLKHLPKNLKFPTYLKDNSDVIQGFGAKMCSGCSALEDIPESLSIEGIKDCRAYFMEQAFKDCSSLKKGVISFFGTSKLGNATLNRTGTYDRAFENCTSLTETISPDTIPQLTVSPSSANSCFKGCPSDKIANCPANWK